MTKTYTNKELSELSAALKQISADRTALPAKMCYKIAKNRMKVDQALKPYEQAKSEIIRSRIGERTITYDSDPQAFAEISAEVAIIDKEAVDIELDTISVSELPNGEMPLNLMMALFGMIEEE